MPQTVKILHLESATTICSVALSSNEKLLVLKESAEPNSHSRLLTLFVEEALKEAGWTVSDLDAIAVSIGPGSYTGLRIGVSAAKGLAYGAHIPIIAIDTLMILANRVLLENAALKTSLTGARPRFRALLDARRMEVYTALYNPDLEQIEEVNAQVITESSFLDDQLSNPLYLFGNGAEKCREIIRHPAAQILSGIETSAVFMINLALKKFHQKEFVNTAYFEPFYLKDFIATLPRNKVIPNQKDRPEQVD